MRTVVVASLVVAAQACTSTARQAETDTSPAVSVVADTLVGVVSEMGAYPATWFAVVPPGARSVRLSGNVASLRNITGAEVWLSGVPDADGFRVETFEVRRVNGQPVDDGIVVVHPDRVEIRTSMGATRVVPDAPPSLRGLPGARVWVTHPVTGRAPSFGVVTLASPRD